MSTQSTSIYIPIEERIKNFKLFYDKRNVRPLTGFFAGSEYPLFRYKAAGKLPKGRPLVPEDFDIEQYLDDCDRLFDMHEECGGDFIWSASAFWGIPWLEAALGCPIYAYHVTGSIFSEQPPEFSGAHSIPNFDADSSWIRLTKDFLLAMDRRSSGRWPIATTRMRGITDLLSALYGGVNFVYAMMEKPDEVKQICKK